MNEKAKAALKRLREFLHDKEVEVQVLGVGAAARIVGVSRDRVHTFISSKRLKAQMGLGLNPSYEIMVSDLREFIVNDYAIAKPGRPKTEKAL